MNKAKNIWSLKSGINDVEKDLIHFFSADGFDFSGSENDTGKIRISANNRIKLPRLFFQSKRPEIIKCALYSDNTFSTRVEVSYEFTSTFMNFAYLALLVSAGIMFGPIYIANYYSHIELVLSICIPLSFIGYCAFMYVLYRIMINDHYRILFKYLKNKGHAPLVIERPHVTKYIRNIVSFAFALLAILCLPLSFAKPQYAIFFYATILIGLGAYLCIRTSSNKIIRSPHFIVLFLFAVIFAIYGIFPLLTLAPPITASSIIFLCVSIIFTVVILNVLKNTMRIFLESVNILRKNPEEIKFDEKRSIPLTIFLATTWMFLNIGCFISFVASVNLLEYSILGRNYIFSETAAYNILNGIAEVLAPVTHALQLENITLPLIRLLFVIYLSPVVIIVFYIASSNIWQFISYMKTLTAGEYSKHKRYADIKNIIENISRDNKIRNPYLRIVDSENINAYCIFPVIPLTRNIVAVTTASCEQLSQEEMKALIAHELGHLYAKHSFIFSILNFFSRWTFLGEGFASMLTKNSKVMETEADKFAVLWLKKNSTIGKKALLELLKTQEKQRIKASMSLPSKDSFRGLPAFKIDWQLEKLISESTNYPQKTFCQKRLYDCRLLTFFIFHGWMSTYMHVSYDERIRHINDF